MTHVQAKGADIRGARHLPRKQLQQGALPSTTGTNDGLHLPHHSCARDLQVQADPNAQDMLAAGLENEGEGMWCACSQYHRQHIKI